MALSKRRSGWHVLARLAGLTGLVVALGGLVAWSITEEQDPAMYVVLGGGIVVALALLVEIKGLFGLAVSRRGALGFNVALQVLLAAAVVAGVNLFSFYFHQRFDWTRDREFTIPPDIREQLSQLRGDTRIIVFQGHTSFGQVGEKRDNYDAAAERQIVAKVKDLAEEFQELGPRFRVEIFDIQEEVYEKQLNDLKKEAPKLAAAIEKAPENSIFFYAAESEDNGTLRPPNDKARTRELVQRLSFHDIYQLDKPASREANKRRGNLVLRYQGIGPFARKILNVDEKPPRVAVAVIHQVLGLENTDELGNRDLGMSGARKTLQTHGFLSKDIVLKKWSESAPPVPAVLTYDESRYEDLEEQLKELDANIDNLEKERALFQTFIKEWESKPLKELKNSRLAKQLELDDVTEEDRRAVLDRVLRPNLALRELALKQHQQDRTSAVKEKSLLNVENLDEQRRIADLYAKLKRMLEDVDLLIVPRMTLFNVALGERGIIPNSVHRLEQAHVSALKDFIKAGKPVLFCLGPANEPAGRFDPESIAGDRIESIVSDVGFQMPKQTILFNVESKAFSERRSGLFARPPQIEIPPVQFDWPAGAGLPGLAKDAPELPANPIRVSMRISARSLGKEQTLDLRLRHPRPVYVDPKKLKDLDVKLSADPIFMMTSPEAWNEDQPFPTRERTPRFELPKANDPERGTIRAKRRGYFPIAAAMETRVPASWQESAKAGEAPKARLAVIGHGGVFMGPELTPAKEKLLLDTCNWLLGRDDLLARDTDAWQFPRVPLTDADPEYSLWRWGTFLGMPVLFIYIGLAVLMIRRMR